MKRWLRRSLILAALLAAAYGIFYEAVTRVGRGWLVGEPFYEGRPASYWSGEIEQWETNDPEWRTARMYTRPSRLPRWMQVFLPEPQWPRLLDGDPDGREVLEWLSKHPSEDIRDWARIGIERIENDERGPHKFTLIDVLFSVKLSEVDEDFYKRINNNWHSKAELDELEREWLGQIARKKEPEQKPAGESLFAQLDRQVPLATVENFKIKEKTEGLLVSLTKTTRYFPTPLQMRLGKSKPQIVEENLTLRARVTIFSDRRGVRLTFVEKSTEIEGIDKLAVILDSNGKEGIGHEVSMKELALSFTRTVPDGGSFLLALQHQPLETKQKGGRLVARIQTRIYIEEEERQIQAAMGK